MKGTQPN